MNALKMANLALAFLLELCALAAFAWWGYQAGQGTLAQIALAVGAPLVVAVFWGLFVAPRARFSASPTVKFVLALVVFAAATVALFATGQATLAWVFLVAAVVNRILILAWKQQVPVTQA
ncbi:MAG TPA: YrdB family protein [Ktedonobacterales bacterium]|jgi:Protein of unknown function (DUF2568)|nr:YrdB family protein [Ktedonobacterales bacterium]